VNSEVYAQRENQGISKDQQHPFQQSNLQGAPVKSGQLFTNYKIQRNEEEKRGP
jgi:hypothetical protein